MMDRRRARRILLIASIPFALAGLVLAGKLFTLSSVAGAAIADYDRRDFESSAARAEGLLSWNSFEPWIAWFDRGTARAASGFYNQAIDDLEYAFALAPADRKCEVAVNLSLSWEMLADSYQQRGFFAGAQRLYETAEAVIDAAGQDCKPGNAPQNEQENRDPGEELSDAGDRLDDKAAAAEALEQTEGEDADAGIGERLDELGQRNEDAAEDKAEQESRDRGAEGSGGFTDKPW